MFTELRKMYEFIIMDTPAIGFVGDAYLLNRYADVTLFVVRYNYSIKKQFATSVTEAVENNMRRLNIVFTDVKQKIKVRDISFNSFNPDKRQMRLRIIPGIRQFFNDLNRRF